MKLFHKIFLCFVILFSVAFQAAGYLLVNYSCENTIEQEKKYAVSEYQYNKYILQSLLFSGKSREEEAEAAIAKGSDSFTTSLAVYKEDGEPLFSNLIFLPEGLLGDVEEDTVHYQIGQRGEESYIVVYGSVYQNEKRFLLVTETAISQAIQGQQKMLSYFQRIFLIMLGIAFPVILCLSGFLTKNIKKVSKGAKRIAEGNYGERISVACRDEIGELAESFGHMAGKVEEKVQELSEMARQKEDFAANFAHELKTPLTSVIGYADMLCQKELSAEQVKEAAGYIREEGMRLEALSLKLMDLFVMNRQDFYLEHMEMKEVFRHLEPDIRMLCEKKNTGCHMDVAEGCLAITFRTEEGDEEYD